MKLGRRHSLGFSLTELVMVIAIAGILAAFAISRISTSSFDTEGFASQAAAMVRYAQKIAISQHRTVFVVVSGNSIKLCYIDDACGTTVREPPGTGGFFKNAPSGVTIALDSGTYFSFSALGKPSARRVITVTGDVGRTITIEAETGYVH